MGLRMLPKEPDGQNKLLLPWQLPPSHWAVFQLYSSSHAACQDRQNSRLYRVLLTNAFLNLCLQFAILIYSLCKAYLCVPWKWPLGSALVPAEGREVALWKQLLSVWLSPMGAEPSVSLVWSSVSVCIVLSWYTDTYFGLRSFMVSLPSALWCLQSLCSWACQPKTTSRAWLAGEVITAVKTSW